MKAALKRLGRAALSPVLRKLDSIEEGIEQNRMLLVQSRIREFKAGLELKRLTDAEFRVFSQWGEDGILQYLISKVPVGSRVFVEFGVEDYRESNTRFLLLNDNWKGLVIDSSADNIEFIRSRKSYYMHDLSAVCAFVTAENIDTTLTQTGFHGDIGLLSIDIDGNDYWVWKAMTSVSARIVVVEFNNLFGCQRALAVPYDPKFQRTRAHHSNLYYGASLKAFCDLAAEKGYVFAGTNSAGTNAFFVRRDVAGPVPQLSCAEGYIASVVRESRDREGRLTFASGPERLHLIADEWVLDLLTQTRIRLGDALRS